MLCSVIAQDMVQAANFMVGDGTIDVLVESTTMSTNTNSTVSSTTDDLSKLRDMKIAVGVCSVLFGAVIFASLYISWCGHGNFCAEHFAVQLARHASMHDKYSQDPHLPHMSNKERIEVEQPPPSPLAQLERVSSLGTPPTPALGRKQSMSPGLRPLQVDQRPPISMSTLDSNLPYNNPLEVRKNASGNVGFTV